MNSKRYAIGLLCFVLCLMSAFAVQAAEVEAKGVGVAPITKDEATAARVALQLAKRDAVERAIGAEVRAEAIPAEELTRVAATVSGKLTYQVVSEGADKGLYITEIEAKVTIPPDLEAKYPKSAEEETTGYDPLIQTLPHGEINWRDGYLLAKGAAKQKGSDAKSKLEAQRAARLDAYSIALQMISGMKLDPELTVEERLKKAPAIGYKLKGLIRGAEIIDESSKDGLYKVTLKVELRGIKGVQTAFTESMNLKGPDTPIKKAEGEGVYTGVIVDARGTKLNPAVFPEIVDEEKMPVYSVRFVDPSALTARGAAAYVTGKEQDEKDGTKGAFIPNDWLVVTALELSPEPAPSLPPLKIQPPGFADSFRSFLNDPLGAIKSLAQAASTTRIVIRQGPKPVPATAVKSQGPTRSRIVVSNKAANQIRKADNENSFLRQARVVIITDSMIGGTEGRLRMPLWRPMPVR